MVVVGGLLLLPSTSGQGKFLNCLKATTDDSHLDAFSNVTSCWRIWGMRLPIVCLRPGLLSSPHEQMFFCPFEGQSAEDFRPPPPCPPPSPACPPPSPACPPPSPACPPPSPACPPPSPACPPPSPACPPPSPLPTCPPPSQPPTCPLPSCPSCPSTGATTTISSILLTTTTTFACPTTHWALFALGLGLFYAASAGSGFALHWGLQKRKRRKEVKKFVKDALKPSEIMQMNERPQMSERPRKAPPRPPNAPNALLVDLRPEIERKREQKGIGKCAPSAISPFWKDHDKPLPPTLDANSISSDEWGDREEQETTFTEQPTTSGGEQGPAIPTSPEILQCVGLPLINAEEEKEEEEEDRQSEEEEGGQSLMDQMWGMFYFGNSIYFD